MRHKVLAAAMAAVLLFVTSARADPTALADSVDTAVTKWMGAHDIKHAEVAVSARGVIIDTYSHGWGPTDAHSVGSLSKAITGYCIAGLLESGQLRLSDTVGATLSAYFDNPSNVAPVDNRFKTITVEQLLTHKAGLRRNAFEATDKTIEDSFKSAAKTKLQADPGTAISYSNTGYLILGYIAQTVGQSPYETLCGAGVSTLTGGTSGTIEPSLAYRAPNGGWNESADNYAKFIAFLDPNTHHLGPTSRKWLDGLAGENGYAKSDGAGDQPPCSPFGGSPAYGFGSCLLRTEKGTQYFHDGAVVGTPGGSMFFVNEAGYAAVVIFDAEKDYGSLFNALKGSLTVPAAYVAVPSDWTRTPGGNQSFAGGSPCQQGSGAFHKQTHINRTGDTTTAPGHILHPCR